MIFQKGSIVKHQSGEIKGVITNIFESLSGDVSYYISWGDGTISLHRESEIRWASVDTPLEIKNFYEK